MVTRKMWCLCKGSLLVETVDVVEETCQQVVVVVEVVADAVGVADFGQVVADGAAAVVGSQVVVVVVVVAGVVMVADADGGQEIVVGDGLEVVDVWETADHVVDGVSDDVVELWVAQPVVVM